MASSGFSVKVKINSNNKIIKEHGLDKDGKITEFARDTIYKLYEPYTPRDQGNLYRQVVFPNPHSIKHIVPYAHAMYKGNVFISPKLGVSGVVINAKGNQRWWSPKGELKKKTNQKYKYTGAPMRGAEWDKRMMNDRGKEVCRDVENFIKRGGV